MPSTQALPAAARTLAAPCAIAWTDGSRASVAGMTDEGLTWTCEIDRGWLPEPAFLAEVARVVGDRGQVVFLGPDSVRSELQRRYNRMFPEALCQVEADACGPVTAAELVRRLRAQPGSARVRGCMSGASARDVVTTRTGFRTA